MPTLYTFVYFPNLVDTHMVWHPHVTSISYVF